MKRADRQNFRYRQIHLDFHTSEHIEGVAEDFDPEQFIQTLKDGEVNSVTLFARCHHGWCYYPTNVGKPHPHLARPDLLGDMVKACRDADIITPIYLTVQWDELSAREHPEWRVMRAQNWAASQWTPTWHTMCLNHEGYIDYLIAMTREVAERYSPPALFMDILSSWECACNACLASIQGAGLDPLDPKDRQVNDKGVLMRFFERFTTEINGEFPEIRIFYNSGHIHKGQRERYQYYGQLELESLPTGGWGYDHFPASMRYADGLGLPILGMTGRFHTHWGEFGGFKCSEALIFECCQMVALGAHCSIGDQLHPRGLMDSATYKLIKPAYQRVKALEPFAIDAIYQTEVALLSVEAQDATLSGHLHQASVSDIAAARMMMEMQIPFDVIEADAGFDAYRLVILPDDIRLDADFADRLMDYVTAGGAIIATGQSGLSPDRQSLTLNMGVQLSNEPIKFNPSYLQIRTKLDVDLPTTPMVMYETPLAVEKTDGELLATVRPSYFNRCKNKFCSHLHTPEDSLAPDLGAAVVQKGRIAYVAYPLFRMYGASGQTLYKYIIRGLIERLLPNRMIGTNLPSATRISLMAQEAENRQVLHLLYAPTQLRGSGITYPQGCIGPIEIIEDAPEMENVRAWLRCDRTPVTVCCVYSGDDLPWEYDAKVKKLHITFPHFHIHAAAVITLQDN